MKIVILDGYTANPGDMSWKELEELGTLAVSKERRIFALAKGSSGETL